MVYYLLLSVINIVLLMTKISNPYYEQRSNPWPISRQHIRHIVAPKKQKRRLPASSRIFNSFFCNGNGFLVSVPTW